MSSVQDDLEAAPGNARAVAATSRALLVGEGDVHVMLRQCCAPAFNRAKPNSTSRNDIQLDSKFSAGWPATS